LDQSHAQRSEHGEDPPVVQSARLVQAAATREGATAKWSVIPRFSFHPSHLRKQITLNISADQAKTGGLVRLCVGHPIDRAS
jgi:hypothetical protein